MQLTSQQRNAQASSGKGVSIPIPPFTITPYTPFLAALEATTMGKYGTSGDGFDAALAPLVAALPDHDTQVAAMSKTLLAAAFTPGTIVGTIYNPIGVQIAALAKAGDAQLADFTGTTNGGAPAPPPPQPKPRGSGGGGGGGSGLGGETPGPPAGVPLHGTFHVL